MLQTVIMYFINAIKELKFKSLYIRTMERVLSLFVS